MLAHNSTNGNEFVRGKGRIEVIIGPMFSGKTTELIRRLRRYQIACFKCLVLKYIGDYRYSENDIVTHDKNTFAAIPCKTLGEYKSKALEYDVLGVDEGQFFPDVISFSESLANLGKVVIIAALDGTFQRQAFGDISKLVPLSESIIKLNAICMVCHNTAAFTKRISNEEKVEIIGGADKYMAVCRECYHSQIIPSNSEQNKIFVEALRSE